MGWRSVVGLCAVVVASAGLVVGMAGSSSRAGAAGQESADQAGIQELAERLLAAPAPTGQPASLELLPGQVASQLPVNLALPAGAHIVGSLVRNAGAPTVSVNVVLDAPGERSSMQTFYEKELADKGWSPLPPGPQAHGFQFGSQPSRPSIFCSPQGNSWLSMGVNAGRDGTNDVRISTNGQIPNPCQRPAQPSPGPLSANSPIPALYAPEGVTMQPGGSGGGPGRWSSEATATTDQKA